MTKNVFVFRTNLRKLREERGLDRSDLVYASKITYQTIYRWETQALNSIDANTLAALCDVLQCDTSDMFNLVPVDETESLVAG